MDRRRTQHRPTDRSALAREVQRLAAGGLKVRDISLHLALGERAVAELLRLEARPEAVTGPPSPP